MRHRTRTTRRTTPDRDGRRRTRGVEIRGVLAAAEDAADGLGVPVSATRHLPVLELLDELRRREFTVAIVSGGGAPADRPGAMTRG